MMNPILKLKNITNPVLKLNTITKLLQRLFSEEERLFSAARRKLRGFLVNVIYNLVKEKKKGK